MTKINADQLLSIFLGLVRDVEDILELSGRLVGDYEVVSKSVKSRGLSVLLIDLPSECKALEKALDSGVLAPRPGAPFTKEGYPKLWSPVYDKIFTDDWRLLEDVDPSVIRCFRQLLKGLKKLSIDCPRSAIEEKVRDFLNIESRLPEPTLSWGAASLRVLGRYPHLTDVGIRSDLGEDSAHDSWSDEDRDNLLRDLSCIQIVSDRVISGFRTEVRALKGRHGPGAVSEPFESSKYEFPTWPERLENVFPFAEYGMANYLSYEDEPYTEKESPCRLIDVPKDYSGPRLIASEPISSQFIQQGIMRLLRKEVSHSILKHCIDFRSQVPSQRLALSASRTRDFATIDLSSASDRLACSVVESVFRRNFRLLEVLNAARTPNVQMLDLHQVLRMKKFAAQGAAFTFPVQTIVYALICIGVCFSVSQSASMAKLAREVRVYGDDMIVPTYAFDRVCRVLEALHLKVNQDKSFSKGYFRESCGVDAYRGTDVSTSSVRSIFDTRNPESLVSVVECANNLYLKGFIRSSSALLDTIPREILTKIPIKGSGSTAFGLVGGGHRPLPRRYNGLLQRDEVKVLVVANKVTKTKPSGRFCLFQWFTENPLPDSQWVPGEVVSVKARYRLQWVDQITLI